MDAITPIPAFRDNYIWALQQGKRVLFVDPGDATPVRHWLAATGLQPVAILITHHHADHTGGLLALKQAFNIPTFGPKGGHIPGIDRGLGEGERFQPAAGFPEFSVLEIPGHTLDHIAYYTPGLLFCGDTLFSAGCGRLFEGSAEQLYHSLMRLAALPADTRVYAGHEYTVSNLKFARTVLPKDEKFEKALANTLKIRENGQESLPSTLAQEREINIFLRVGETEVQEAIAHRAGASPGSELTTLATLRRWKDEFRPT